MLRGKPQVKLGPSALPRSIVSRNIISQTAFKESKNENPL
jgi:hypothetical protein